MTASSIFQFKAFSSTHIGLNEARKENQDAFGEADTRYGYVYVVCDGMGGHAGGAEASRIGVDAILDYLRNELQDSVVQALHEAIIHANRKIFERANAQPELKGMGSTCVVLVLSKDGLAYIAHVGDSRIYGWQDGELYLLTKDHSYVQLLVDQGQIDPSEAESHPSKNKILRALGVEDEVRPTIGSRAIPLSGGMRFLLCTDGLNGMVADADICETMSEAEFSETMAQMLISKALNNGGKDNVTVTIVEIEAAPHTGSLIREYDVRPLREPSSTSMSIPSISDEGKANPRPSRLKYLLIVLPILLIAGYFVFESIKSWSIEETMNQDPNEEATESTTDKNPSAPSDEEEESNSSEIEVGETPHGKIHPPPQNNDQSPGDSSSIDN
jgi:serine/threonine protein phosphatase PrpC